MADKCRVLMKRKQKEAEEVTEEMKNEEDKAGDNGEAAAPATSGTVANGQNDDFQVEPIEPPPFEIITG